MYRVMKKKTIAAIAGMIACAVLLGGCAGKGSVPGQDLAAGASAAPEESPGAAGAGQQESEETEREQQKAERPETEQQEADQAKTALPDGVYTARFQTDSTMFRVNEACDGKGTLTVEDGEMTIHISLGSKKILNLYPGLAEDAQKEGAELLMPTLDSVTYSDGMTEEVHGFDVPVPFLESEFDLALIGTKGTWYDHKVSVLDVMPLEEGTGDLAGTDGPGILEDGTYSIEITFEGGSGKAKILSPALVTVTDGKAVATLQWSSPNYDYMIVGGEKYLPVSTEGGSVFEIPVLKFDEPMDVIGDTVAMSTPHEVEYTLTFHSDKMASDPVLAPSAGAKKGVGPEVDTEKKVDRKLVYESSVGLQYAENFKVDYYEGGYTMLTTTMDGSQFLILPEDGEIPQDLDEDTVVLRRPVKDIYLVASSVMDMFSELGGLDTITFSGQKEEGWYIEAARQAMAKGDILYAGKYNKPDYELIVSKGCTLAIENMMISHSPEVVEKLGEFGIPVMIDHSSYEPHPLGRVEWVKFYGALLGKEKEAGQIFEDQMAILERVGAEEKTGQTVAFFFITSNGLVQIRQPSDYVPKMIELAGGDYIFNDLEDPGTKRSTLNMQVEEFYAGAKDADFLIYNSSIDGGISSIEGLLDKCGVLEDFKAVKEGNVWCTTNDMYQQSLSTGYLIEDIHKMLQGEKDGMHYLFPIE